MAESGALPQLSMFVSYRTSDLELEAAELAALLKRDFGPSAVYHAPSDNEPFDDWMRELDRRLDASDVVLALIGPRWTDGIRDPDDTVAMEVLTGLRTNSVLPVFVGVTGLADGSVPPELEGLRTTHGVVVSDLSHDSADYRDLVVACWLKLKKIDGLSTIVITDGTDRARVELDRLLEAIAREEPDGVTDLSNTVNGPLGLFAVPLRDAATRWSGVIVIAPKKPSERVLATARFVAERRGVKEVTLVGATAAVVSGTALEGLKTTVLDVPSHLSRAARQGWWNALSTGAKAATAAAGVGVAAVAGIGIVAASANSDDPTPPVAAEESPWEPVSMLGAWVSRAEQPILGWVPDSDGDGTSPIPRNGSFPSVTLRFEFAEVASCDPAEDCAFEVLDGPPELRGQVVETYDIGSSSGVHFVFDHESASPRPLEEVLDWDSLGDLPRPCLDTLWSLDLRVDAPRYAPGSPGFAETLEVPRADLVLLREATPECAVNRMSFSFVALSPESSRWADVLRL